MGARVTGEIEAYDVKYLPIVKAYAERIGLVEVINRMVPSEMDVEPGHMVLAMIFDQTFPQAPTAQQNSKSVSAGGCEMCDECLLSIDEMVRCDPGVFWT